jgi:uncharacterized membrane protein
MIDWTITIGNVVQVIGLVGAAFSLFYGLSYRIKGVEKEMEKLSNVIVTLAVQTAEIAHLRKRVDDLSEIRARELEDFPKILRRHQI